MNLSIIVPLYNEDESIYQLIKRIAEVAEESFDTQEGFLYEVIFVDDGSTDRTWEIVEELVMQYQWLTGVKFRRNYGQTSAMVAGFEYASGEIIVTMDGDLQNDPGDIPMLLQELEGRYDIVSGWRKYRKDHFSRVIPSQIANWIISKSTGISLHDYGCSLKAYRAECIKSIKAYGEMHRFFPALASMTGARVKEVPVTHHPRCNGVSKYGFGRIFRVFSDIFSMNIIIRFSSMPLKGFALFALPCLFLMLFFGILGGVAMLFKWTAAKAPLFIFVSVLNLMVVVNLIVLGILGELIVGTSDLTHTQMPEITKKNIKAGCNEK